MRKDWIEVELGTILFQSKEKHTPKEEQELFYVGLEHIEKELGILTDSNRIEKINTLKNKFEPGQILYGKLRPYLNKVYLAKESGVCSTDIVVFQPSEVVFPKFAHLYMLSRRFVNHMSENTSGVNLPRVSTSYINSYPFPLPPLPEQRAIVARIEELFSELDHAVSSLQSAQAKLDIYRQAVLKKAFEGDWKTSTVGEKFDFLGGGTPSKSNPAYWNGDIPWCSVKDVKGDYLFKTVDSISELGVKESATNIAEDGQVILITRISPGKSIISKIRTAINQDLKVVLPKLRYQSKYIHYLFKSLERECVKRSSGTTVLGINLKSLKEIEIPDITEMEQDIVIDFIESRLSVADRLAETIQTNLQKSEAVRQSILKKAFEGRLLSEAEVEACRKEADWEPAERLLERIKSEKTKAKKS